MESEDEAITLVEVLEDTSGGKIRVHRNNLHSGPMRDQDMVDFWEKRLDDLSIPYLLAVVEMAERNVETRKISFTRGQAIFVDSRSMQWSEL
jgi:hypothetical protein